MGDWRQDYADRETKKFNSGLEKFRKIKSYLYLPSDFKATGMDLNTIEDPNVGRVIQDGQNIDETTGRLLPNSGGGGGRRPDYGFSFGTNGIGVFINPIAAIRDIVNLFNQKTNDDTQETQKQIRLEREKYNQKKQKHEDLFFKIVKNNQTSRIFAGGDLYNAGAGSKQYDPLSPYEPYKYFMEQSDVSLENIRVIMKDELPKAGRGSYYPGVDREIEWAGGNKNIRASELILNTQLRTTYQTFKKEADTGTFNKHGINGSFIFNYSLNDLLNRRMRAIITDFKLKNKS